MNYWRLMLIQPLSFPLKTSFSPILEKLRSHIECLEKNEEPLNTRELRHQILEIVKSHEFLNRLKETQDDDFKIIQGLYHRSVNVLVASQSVKKIADVALKVLAESSEEYMVNIASYLVDTVFEKISDDQISLDLGASEINVNDLLTFALIHNASDLVDVLIKQFKEIDFDEFVFSEGIYQDLTFAQAYLFTISKGSFKANVELLKSIKLEQWLKPVSSKSWEEYSGYTPLLIALASEIPLSYSYFEGLRGYRDWKQILTYPSFPKHLSHNPEFSSIKELSGKHALKALSERSSQVSSDLLCLFLALGHSIDWTFYKPYLWKKALLDGDFHEGLFQHLINQKIGYIPFFDLVEMGKIEAILRLMEHKKLVLEDLYTTLNEKSTDSFIENVTGIERNFIGSIQIHKPNKSRSRVLRALCEIKDTEHLDLLVLLIKVYYSKNFMQELEGHELWKIALECEERPHIGLLELLVHYKVPGSPCLEDWHQLDILNHLVNREVKYAALFKVWRMLDTVKKLSTGETQTPLCHAILQHDTALACSLIYVGADPNISVQIDKKDWTPLEIALSDNNHKIATALVNYGADLEICLGRNVSQSKGMLEKVVNDLINASTDFTPNEENIKKLLDLLNFASAVFRKIDLRILNRPFEEGKFEGKTVLQILIENKIWRGVAILGSLKVNVGSVFNNGPFQGMSALQAIGIAAFEAIQDRYFSMNFKNAIGMLVLAADSEDFVKKLPVLEKYERLEQLTFLHLMALAGIELPIDSLQRISNWPDLAFPPRSLWKRDTVLTLLARRGSDSLPQITHYIASGCDVSDYLLAEIFDKIVSYELKNSSQEQIYYKNLNEFFMTLQKRGIAFDWHSEDGEPLLRSLFNRNKYEGFLSLVTAGAILTTEDLLKLAVDNVKEALDFQVFIKKIDQGQNFSEELKNQQMTPKFFSWLCRQFPALALLFFERFSKSISLLSSKQKREFYDEANLKALIQNSGSPLLLAKFLCACPDEALRSCGTLFPLAASMLDDQEMCGHIISVFTKVPPGPNRISVLLDILIASIGEDRLKAAFLNQNVHDAKDGITLAQRSEAYLIQRSQAFTLSKEHLERSLNHPLIAQPDPNWSSEMLSLPRIVNLKRQEEIDKECSIALREEFLRLFDLIPVSNHSFEEILEHTKLREGLESGLHDLLNPEESKAVLADSHIEKRKKSYLLILHYLSHVIFSKTLKEGNEHFLTIKSLAEAMSYCLPRRTFAASRAYGKEVGNIQQTYSDEWMANMGSLRLNSTDMVVARLGELKSGQTQNIHTLTSIVNGLGKLLALSGYRGEKDKIAHFIHYLSVKRMFFDIYSVDNIVYQTVADMKNPEIKSLYEQHWLNKPKRDWEEAWLQSHDCLMKILKIEIDKLLVPNFDYKQKMNHELIKIDQEIDNLTKNLVSKYGERKENQFSSEVSQEEIVRQNAVLSQLNQKRQERYRIQFETPVFAFASWLSENHITLNSIAIQTVLDSEISYAEKKSQLDALLLESCIKQALHDHLWEDFMDEEGHVVASIPRSGPLYATLEELGAFIHQASVR